MGYRKTGCNSSKADGCSLDTIRKIHKKGSLGRRDEINIQLYLTKENLFKDYTW
jgi:hypothetical protein